LQRIDFYKFDNLQKYLPRLKSIQEFMTSGKYLGNIKVEISALPGQAENLSAENKLHVAI